MEKQTEGDPSAPGYEILGPGDDGLYQARQVQHNRQVLLRHFDGSAPADLPAAAKLDHAGLARIVDSGTQGNRVFIATEHVDGPSLRQLVEGRGVLPVSLAGACMLQACRTLEAMHAAGIVQGHVSPSRLIVCAEPGAHWLSANGTPLREAWSGQPATVKLVPLSPALTGNALPVGVTPEFVSPEQLMPGWQPDPRTDLYGLGCVYYYLLAGRLPFTAGSLQETLDKVRWLPPRPVNLARPEVPAKLAEVIRKLMAKNPAERYLTAAAAAEAIEEFARLDAPVAVAAPPRPVTPPVPVQAAPAVVQPEPPPPAPVAELPPAEPAPPASADAAPRPRFTPLRKSHQGTDRPPLDASSREAWRARFAVPARGSHHGTPKPVDGVESPAPASPAAAPHTQRLHRLLADQIERSDYLGAQASVAELLAEQSDETASAAQEFLDGTVGLWTKFDKHTEAVTSVTFAPNGKLAASTGLDKTIRVWDLASGKQRQAIACEQLVHSVSAMKDSKQVLAGTSGGYLHLWEMESGKESKRFKGYDGDVLWVSAPAVGPLAVAGTRRGGAVIWDLTVGSAVRALIGHTSEITCAVWSTTARWLLTCSPDNSVRLWGGDKFPERGRLQLGERQIPRAVAFATENMAVVGISDGSVVSYRLNDFKEAHRFKGHTGPVNAVVANGDGSLIVSGSADGTVRCWDGSNAKQLALFEGHTDEVLGVAMSADGRFALSGSKDKTIRLWKLPARPQ